MDVIAPRAVSSAATTDASYFLSITHVFTPKYSKAFHPSQVAWVIPILRDRGSAVVSYVLPPIGCLLPMLSDPLSLMPCLSFINRTVFATLLLVIRSRAFPALAIGATM